MKENTEVTSLKNKYDFADVIRLQNRGITALNTHFERDLARVLETFFVPKEAPDKKLDSVKDLIRVANLISREHEMPSLYPSHINRRKTVRMFLPKEKLYSFLTNPITANVVEKLESGLLKKINPVDKETADYSINEEYEKILSVSNHFSEILFEHILPVNSVEKKAEAVRVYESVRSVRNLVDFLFHQKPEFYRLKNSVSVKKTLKHGPIPFVIPIAVNFPEPINGIINWDGKLLVSKDMPVFSSFDITRIQECKICGKFLLVTKGKVNVDKTCSPKHAKQLKNIKNNKSYAASPEVFVDNSIYRDEIKETKNELQAENGENDNSEENNPDRYTASSFGEIFRKNEFLTSLYNAWTETYFHRHGPVPRRERVRIKEFAFENPDKSIIFDTKIFQNYLPIVAKNNIILVNQQTLFLVHYFDSKNLQSISNKWRAAASAKLSTGLRKVLAEKSASIIERRWKLFKDAYPSGFEKVNLEHQEYLAQCEIVATSVETDSTIIVSDINDYQQFFDICKNNLIEIKDLKTSKIL